MEMVKIILLVIVLSLALVTGCASTGHIIQEGVKATEQDVKNVEQLREMARNLLKTWPMYSGMIAGTFGDRLTHELPARVVMAMGWLDEMSAQYTMEELTDYQLGFSLGLRVQIAFSVVREAIKQFAPEIFDLLPVIL